MGLKFIGNAVGLRNPELVPTLVSDIKEQQDQHAGSKFLFCLHVGTTAGESIKTKRAGFMEGRSQSLLDALHENNEELGVGAASAFDDTPFEHFKSTRFAGLVMKVYTGDVAPTCAKEDLVPPSAYGSEGRITTNLRWRFRSQILLQGIHCICKYLLRCATLVGVVVLKLFGNSFHDKL